MSWFDEQGRQSATPYRGGSLRGGTPTPYPGGAVVPIEPGYQPDGGRAGVPRQRTPPAGAADRINDPTNHRTQGGAAPVSDEAVQAILHKYPATNDGMRAAMVEIDRTFGPGTIKLLDHPQRLDKLVMPDGRTIDAMIGAGASGASWGWMVEGAGHGGGAAGGGTLGGLSPQGVGPLIGSPMAGKPLIDDPSYQFRLGEGLKALERSAAAKGTLLTGGAAKGLMRFAQDYASTEFQNAYARAASEQGNNFNRLYSVSNLGLNATGQAQNLASGYAGNIAGTQIGQGNVQAGATQANANGNANTLTTLGNLAGQWLTNRYANGGGGSDPNGGYVDVGRGLY